MLKFLVFFLVLFFLIRFLVRFLLPIAKLTQMTHRSMADIRQKMEAHQNASRPPRQKPRPKPIEGEYIDYEEVK